MKFQKCSDQANCIDINFHSLSYMSFFIQRLRLLGGVLHFLGVNYLYCTFVCTSDDKSCWAYISQYNQIMMEQKMKINLEITDLLDL